MQRLTRFGKQVLIERVANQRLFECVLTRLPLLIDQIRRLNCCEPIIDAGLVNSSGQ
jgi:hypothetical protein